MVGSDFVGLPLYFDNDEPDVDGYVAWLWQQLCFLRRNDWEAPAAIPTAAVPSTEVVLDKGTPHSPGTAYVVGHRFLLDDFRPIVWKTSDYGATWVEIATGLPADEMARSIREDITRPGLLYLGTERGVWASFDAGTAWHKLQANLPAVQVADLAVTDHDLVIATHGRSFWVMDNIDVLRQVSPATKPETRLFVPAPAVRGVDAGVAIDYYLGATPKSLAVEIFGPDGALIQRFEGKAEAPKKDEKPAGGDDDEDEGDAPKGPPTANIKPGMNRFIWAMRHPGFTAFDGMILWSSRNRGVLALPGAYKARLVVDGKVQEQAFAIARDPRVTQVSDADLKARFDLAQAVTARVSEANQAVLLVRGIRAQAQAQMHTKTLPAAVTSLLDRLAAVEAELYQVRNQSRQDPLNYPIKLNDKLAGLIGVIDNADVPPTDGARAVLADLSGQLARQLQALEMALADLPAANAALKAAGLKPLTRTPLVPGAPVLGATGSDADDEAS